MATIKEISRKAGVSATTVANVIHGRTNKVSAATLHKVQAIIDSEKYAPNMGAMMLLHNNSRIIGVIMFTEPRHNETVLEDPFSSAILGAMERDIRVAGYYMMLYVSSDEDEVVRLSKSWKMDGLILVWVPGKICSIINSSIDIPLVYIDCFFNDDDHVYYNIGLEDKKGGYEVTKYLLSMGHTNMLFLPCNPIFPGGDSERFAGCKQAFSERGLTLPDTAKLPLPYDRMKREKIYLEITSKKAGYTALVFSSDYYAAEALTFLQDCGVRIPQDISITGFDDNIFSRLVTPRLTTVHQDSSEKGRLAIEMLMRLIHGEAVKQPRITLPIYLQIRDSVRKL
ncbi:MULTISPECIES: LacI family DNA-binding transcriptional regulator [unclassified Sphaerochaeta]|jgi:LacI family transcriptional regulator|uniref:LacI family DNA-binding transcriptional regulator n=1 Tax=unclassified Sphaerochaeta TaxID=2637943 RepID=UPI000ED58CDF|nr:MULTISPECIES: LacI family DNA-binding transcriptional regulator [unclassified Sphaerochaeta]MDX9824958.1 LacI family DNA-binding transcriptional regulator [Sphaerochaeta sp.]HCU29394.1 LacI family transcriptional regulator [Sphaerochaeta sp.]